MTESSEIAVSRSFYYRERTAEDNEKNMSFNWHYDRMNFGCMINDIYLQNGKDCEHPKAAGFKYNDADSN